MGLTWQELAAMRAKGLRPAVPVAILSGRWGRTLWESMPCIHLDDAPRLELLRGLDVALFTGCGPAREIAKQMRDSGVFARRLLTWCEADKTLAPLYGSCTCRI